MHWVTGACHTCQRLWEAIPSAYRKGHCCMDFWAVYQAVIPDEQHTAVGPRDGRNRSYGTLEEHTAAASGPFCAHDSIVFKVGGDATPACLLFSLHRYHRERATLLK